MCFKEENTLSLRIPGFPLCANLNPVVQFPLSPISSCPRWNFCLSENRSSGPSDSRAVPPSGSAGTVGYGGGFPTNVTPQMYASIQAHPGNVYFWPWFLPDKLKSSLLETKLSMCLRILQHNVFIAWSPNNRVFVCLFFAVWDTRLFKAHALKLNTISSADGVNNKNVEGNRAGEIACDYYLRAGWSIYWRGSSASKHIQIREADVTELLSLLNVLLPSELPSSPGVTALWPVCTRDTGPGFPSGNIWSRWGDRKELPFFLRNTLLAIHVFLKSVWFLATWAMRLSNYRYLRHTEITLPAEMNAAIKAIGITLATAAKKHW